ncbi:MAG TPA: hypothetical protein VH373_08340 [Jatrophihabitantaceae bacterium]
MDNADRAPCAGPHQRRGISDGHFVYLTFSKPPGGVDFLVEFDVSIQPGGQLGESATVKLIISGHGVAHTAVVAVATPALPRRRDGRAAPRVIAAEVGYTQNADRRFRRPFCAPIANGRQVMVATARLSYAGALGITTALVVRIRGRGAISVRLFDHTSAVQQSSIMAAGTLAKT